MITNGAKAIDLKQPARRIRLAMLAVVLLVLSSVIVMTSASVPEGSLTNEQGRMLPTEPGPADYSHFGHETTQHKRLPCLVCHVRSDNTAAPKMPGHIPCASCHVQQFAEGNSNPICSICHTATDVKRFPSLKSFNAVFDHGRHARQTNCATCHKASNRGVALSIPSRLSAHTTCFQCHGPRTMIGEKNIGSCSTCHQPGTLVRTRESARAFARNFNHAEHSRKGLSCSDCHTLRPGMRRGGQVTSPVASMHFAPGGVKSCAACHNDRRAFGDDNFTNCRRCHEGPTFRF